MIANIQKPDKENATEGRQSSKKKLLVSNRLLHKYY